MWKLLRCFFLYLVFEIWYIFYTYCTTQFRLVTFLVLSNHTWWVATILDSLGLECSVELWWCQEIGEGIEEHTWISKIDLAQGILYETVWNFRSRSFWETGVKQSFGRWWGNHLEDENRDSKEDENRKWQKLTMANIL